MTIYLFGGLKYFSYLCIVNQNLLLIKIENVMEIKVKTLANSSVMLYVYFKHYRARNYTKCIIKNSNNVIVRLEKAYCSPNDNFNKAIGRKVALKKCVGYWNKKIRTDIWEGYFKYCPNDK